MVSSRAALWRIPSRFTLAHGLMVSAALLAFTSTRAVLDQRGARIEILVAAEDLERGRRIDRTAPELRVVSIPAGLVLQSHLVGSTESGSGVLVRSVRAGEPLLRSDLVDAAPIRTMSLPVERRVTAGLGLVVGDAVDVIGLDAQDRPAVVAEGLRVARLTQPSGSTGLVAPGAEFVTVEVGPEQALALVAATARHDLELLRATGAIEGGS